MIGITANNFSNFMYVNIVAILGSQNIMSKPVDSKALMDITSVLQVEKNPKL